MSDHNRGEFFDEYFESSYKHGNIFSKEQQEKDCALFDRELKGLLPEDRQAKILDLGCGTGSFLYYLKSKGYVGFFGIDISPQQVEYCKAHVTDQVMVARGAEFLQQAQGQYDCIVAQDVLEHIPKDHTLPLLKAIKAALKPGGSVIIRVPNMSNPFGLDARFNDFTHEIGFTSKSLFQVLTVAGFKDVRILPSIGIEVKSIKSFIRSLLIKLIHVKLKFCFYVLDYTVPKNLDKNIIGVARSL